MPDSGLCADSDLPRQPHSPASVDRRFTGQLDALHLQVTRSTADGFEGHNRQRPCP